MGQEKNIWPPSIITDDVRGPQGGDPFGPRPCCTAILFWKLEMRLGTKKILVYGKTAQISTAWHQILNILYRVSPDNIITGWSYSIIHIQSLRFEPVPGRLRRSLSLLLWSFGLTAFLKPGCITALRFFCHPSRPKFATICQFARTRSICRIRMEQISSLCSKMKWAFT